MSVTQTIVMYAVITWGFNQQEQRCVVMLPEPQHKSGGGSCAGGRPGLCLAEACFAVSQSNVCFLPRILIGEKSQSKFRLTRTSNMTLITEGKIQ